MTMEALASEDNLMRAFEKVAQNDGAPGPDRQSVDEVRAHLDVVLPALRRELLEGSYRPGLIRRVWIQKAGGGLASCPPAPPCPPASPEGSDGEQTWR
jgi:retron-type reverse transcriptase